MKIVAHRRNQLAELDSTPVECGVEVDIRTNGSNLIIHHEPFVAGTSFEEWLDHYRHGMLILNVKEEGLEDAILGILRERRIEDFFFLDQSFPFIVKTTTSGEPRCAVRVSEYESVSTALSMAGKAEWVWLDCFTRFPLEETEWQELKNAGYKICLVSPELQGRWSEDEITDVRRKLLSWNSEADAVCTKLDMQHAWLQPLQ